MYETGVMASLVIGGARLLWLWASAGDVLSSNLAAVGLRKSMATGNIKEGGSAFAEAIGGLVLVGLFSLLSWIGVLLEIMFAVRGISGESSAPEAMRQAIWRLKHVRMSRDEIVHRHVMAVEQLLGRRLTRSEFAEATNTNGDGADSESPGSATLSRSGAIPREPARPDAAEQETETFEARLMGFISTELWLNAAGQLTRSPNATDEEIGRAGIEIVEANMKGTSIGRDMLAQVFTKDRLARMAATAADRFRIAAVRVVARCKVAGLPLEDRTADVASFNEMAAIVLDEAGQLSKDAGSFNSLVSAMFVLARDCYLPQLRASGSTAADWARDSEARLSLSITRRGRG
jgi:hypothetical protein